MHAKVFTSDDKKAGRWKRSTWTIEVCIIILSAGLYLHRSGEIATIEKDFQQTLRRCKKITLEDVKAEKLIRKVTGSLLETGRAADVERRLLWLWCGCRNIAGKKRKETSLSGPRAA